MAVDPLQLPGEEPEPVNLPSKLLWSVVFALLLTAGAAATVLLWPKSMPTNGWFFGMSLTVLPAAFASFVVARRFSAFEVSKLDVRAKNEVVRAYNRSVFDAASKPFTVVFAAHRFSFDRDENALIGVHDRSIKLISQAAIASDAPPVIARWIELPCVSLAAGSLAADMSRHKNVTKWLFAELIDELIEAIKALPPRVSVNVHFFMSSLLPIEERDRLWNDAWWERGLRNIDIAASDEDHGLMALDRWLDEAIETPDSKARLVLAVQLNVLQSASPPSGAAEAGVALLLLPHGVATRHKMKAAVALHRPVRAGYEQANDALQPALKWADSSAADIEGGWQTGLEAAQWGRVYPQAALLGLTEDVIKMDLSIGNTRVAAPWLAIACAAKSLSDDTSKQMVFAGSKSTFDCAVLVRPVANDVSA
ncbi:hypothetical protein [Caballeronia sordidicola]|uniref:hypothetical protein n=1 Tax=Caballeronia sordidicola TaxID=196367 RepID=UPI0004D0244F|nr:hypothetical protein [Caballeronia sordidicola]